jgi:polysaccharide biosynthesis transport protein
MLRRRDVKPGNLHVNPNVQDSNAANAYYPAAGDYPHYTALPPDNGGSLPEIVAAIARRKYLLLGTIAAALAAATLFVMHARPVYRAEAHILIEPQQPGAAIVQSVAAELRADQEAVHSETYVLRSSELINRVITTLQLQDEPEFNSALREPSASQAFLSLIGLGDAKSSPVSDASDSAAPPARDSQLIKRFRDRLTVAPVEDARVILLQFLSQDAERAQEITNTIASEYMAMRQQAKRQSTSDVSGWLDRQIDELRGKVADGENRIEALRRQYGLIEGGEGNLDSQELAEVNSQLVAARAARAEATARLDKVTGLLQTPGGVQSASEVLNSELIRRLREQQSRLEATIAELYTELGPKHPRMLQLRAEEQELQQKISGEIDKIVAGLQNEVDVAEARVNSLQDALNSTRQRVASANEHQVEVRALQREVDANRALLTNLLARQKQTQPQNDSGFLQADARIISPATLPTEAVFPNKALVYGLAVVAATLLGGLLILLLEMLDNGFRSPEQLEAQTSARALGFIPRCSFKKAGAELRHLEEKPSSAFAEAIRTLLWSLRLEFGQARTKVVLITSAQPGEGKTTIASSVAATQGRAGKKVLLIDADLRRPAVHERFGHSRNPGLVDYLSGQCAPGQIYNHNEAMPGVCVISAGSPDIDVQDRLASDAMQQLIEQARSRFDLVIIDSPPVLVGADARLLSRLADASVLVVKWGATRRQVVKLALERLQSAGSGTPGALLSQVEVRKYAQYSYGDSGAYAGDMARYYAGS